MYNVYSVSPECDVRKQCIKGGHCYSEDQGIIMFFYSITQSSKDTLYSNSIVERTNVIVTEINILSG